MVFDVTTNKVPALKGVTSAEDFELPFIYVQSLAGPSVVHESGLGKPGLLHRAENRAFQVTK